MVSNTNNKKVLLAALSILGVIIFVLLSFVTKNSLNVPVTNNSNNEISSENQGETIVSSSSMSDSIKTSAETESDSGQETVSGENESTLSDLFLTENTDYKLLMTVTDVTNSGSYESLITGDYKEDTNVRVPVLITSSPEKLFKGETYVVLMQKKGDSYIITKVIHRPIYD